MNVIFDFDGTLADTMPMLEAYAIGALMTYDKTKTEAEHRAKYRRTIGAPFSVQMAQEYAGEPWVEELIRLYENWKRKYYRKAKPFPEAAEVINALNAKGLRTQVVSSTSIKLVKAFVENNGLNLSDISGNQGGDDKAAQIRTLVGVHGEAMFVSDAPKDFNYAFAANVRFLGVQGTFTYRDFAEHGLASVQSLRGVLAYATG